MRRHHANDVLRRPEVPDSSKNEARKHYAYDQQKQHALIDMLCR